MIPLFLGLTAANLSLLLGVFTLGLFVVDHTGSVTNSHSLHLLLGVCAGLLCALTHVGVYMYHMATARWLQAATDKVGMDPMRWAAPALARKRKVFAVVMSAIVITMLTMFAGAGADPTAGRWWPGEVHLMMGVLAIAMNVSAAISEYRHIRAQGAMMDDALAVLNQSRQADVNVLPQ